MIEVSGLVKRFKNITAVKGIDFHVKKGEVFGFLGPNGAGKTTTIKMLCTIMKQDAGKVTVNGFDTLKESSKVRKSIGIIFQEPSLDNDLSVYENLYFHSRLFSHSKKFDQKEDRQFPEACRLIRPKKGSCKISLRRNETPR